MWLSGWGVITKDILGGPQVKVADSGLLMIFTQYLLSDVYCSLVWLSGWGVIFKDMLGNPQIKVAVSDVLMIFAYSFFPMFSARLSDSVAEV